jgi:hypothetical protein
MHIADAVYSEWEVLRYHRWKRSLIQELGRELLRGFLAEHLDYDLYSEHFAGDLAEILEDNLPEDQASLRRRWRASVPGMKRTLSRKSGRFSPASHHEHRHSPA